MPGTATAAHTESGADSHRAVVATLEIQERGGEGAQAAPDLVLTRAGAQIEGLKRPYTDKQLRELLKKRKREVKFRDFLRLLMIF